MKGQKKNLFSVLCSLFSVARYRFFIFAGLLPYSLGTSVAYWSTKRFDLGLFLVGLLGVAFVLIAVECFNEYFDSKLGSDRVFSNSHPQIPGRVLGLGLVSFSFALIVACYLTAARGWLIMAFAILGFSAACFYVAPPIRWAYRGLGEVAIATSYGPLLTLGSYYLQAKAISWAAIIVSLISGFLIFSLAILNEIPDYYQDRLVGKKNIVVRLGQGRSIGVLGFGWICAFIVLGLGIWRKEIPRGAFVAFLTLPFVLSSIKVAKDSIGNPELFISAIRTSAITYVIVGVSLGISYLRG